MIKKKLLALGVSAVAVTAVAGAGFAGWTFTSEAKQEHNLGINITAAYSFGTLAVDTANAPDTVVLDQGGVTLAKTGALDTAIDNVTATWTVATTSYTDADTAGLTYAVNVYVKGTTTTGLASYVKGGATAGTVISEATSDYNGYTQYVVTPTTAVSTSGDNTVVTITLANPLGFIDGKKPENFAAYQAMVAAITGTSDTVVTDTAYDVATSAKPVIIEFTVTKATD